MSDPVIPFADSDPEPNPFVFDPVADAERRRLELLEHQDDMTPPWPLERLAEALRLPDELPAGQSSGLGSLRWQEAPVRVADLRFAFDHIDELTRQVGEARELARELLGAGQENAEDRTFLSEFNPDLEWELLPEWLTGEAGAPQTWEQPFADQAAYDEEGRAATFEYDPDLGRDLDDDEEREEQAGGRDSEEQDWWSEDCDDEDEY